MIFSEWMAQQDHPKTKAFHVNLVRRGFERGSAEEFHGLLNPEFKEPLQADHMGEHLCPLREEPGVIEVVPLHGDENIPVGAELFICPTSRPMNRSDDPEEYEHAARRLQSSHRQRRSPRRGRQFQSVPRRIVGLIRPSGWPT